MSLVDDGDDGVAAAAVAEMATPGNLSDRVFGV